MSNGRRDNLHICIATHLFQPRSHSLRGCVVRNSSFFLFFPSLSLLLFIRLLLISFSSRKYLSISLHLFNLLQTFTFFFIFFFLTNIIFPALCSNCSLESLSIASLSLSLVAISSICLCVLLASQKHASSISVWVPSPGLSHAHWTREK